MAFNDAITKIINTRWSISNTFHLIINFPISKVAGFVDWSTVLDGRDINNYIVNFNTPDFSNTPIEIYTGLTHRIHNGKEELYRFSITFRDFDQMKLYSAFLSSYRLQRDNYFDDIKMSINVSKEPDHEGEILTPLMIIEDCMIEGVSNLDINNNNEAAISEFTVKFKARSVSH